VVAVARFSLRVDFRVDEREKAQEFIVSGAFFILISMLHSLRPQHGNIYIATL